MVVRVDFMKAAPENAAVVHFYQGGILRGWPLPPNQQFSGNRTPPSESIAALENAVVHFYQGGAVRWMGAGGGGCLCH